MKLIDGRIRLSPTDLANYAACRHLTALDLKAARGEIAPEDGFSHVTAALRKRGEAHEAAYIAHLKSQGLSNSDLRGQGLDSPTATLEAMQAGVDVIVQAPLVQDGWGGYADVLRRVDTPSDLGGWSYEPLDTKLARETRGSAILQLCAYAAVLEQLQGLPPEHLHVVSPGDPFAEHTFRRADYAAYYRRIRRQLEERVNASPEPDTYPDPVQHCDICRWWAYCDAHRRRDDHLSLVAGIRALHIEQFQRWGVPTLEALGTMALPLPGKPDRGSIETLVPAREQARVQLAGRVAGAPVHELLDLVPDTGLHRLPAPSPGDIFFDIEGDPFVPKDGLEYLFGWVCDDGPYEAVWALTPDEEKRAFERFVDVVMARWAAHPGLHIYHYAPYEPSAVKRLMGRYATREDEVDRMLRAELFVDLYAIVRQGVRASVERYSIKSLEPFYAFARQLPLAEASAHLRTVENLLEFGAGSVHSGGVRLQADHSGGVRLQPDHSGGVRLQADQSEIPNDARRGVEQYNEDDCRSALALRGWLEALRAECIAQGKDIPRPAPPKTEIGEKLTERQARTRALMDRLLAGVPVVLEDRSAEEQARWLLAQLLEFHRREDKATWWEKFRLADLPPEDYLDEPCALDGLTFVGRVGGTDKAPVHRYAFPPQEFKSPDKEVHAGRDRKIGTVDDCDIDGRTIDIKKMQKTADVHPERVFFFDRVPVEGLQDALHDLGEQVAAQGISGAGPGEAVRGLLLRTAPRLVPGCEWLVPGEVTAERARRLVGSLDRTVLPVQGPPGAGKTYVGGQMICELVKRALRVGVCANHQVIIKLLETALEAGAKEGLAFRCIRKGRKDEEPSDEGPIICTKKSDAVLSTLSSGDAQVAGGTAWLWAEPGFREAVDVLIVDEAGQMSLANVVAAGLGARSVVLLGDPQQLEQPLKGSHPDGTALSPLHHVLGGLQTMPDERGLFLPETWRLSPALAAFTSELFYEGRLRAREGLEVQQLHGGIFTGSGLWYLPVEHQGNQNHSPEEVDAVAGLAEALVAGHTWTNEKGVTAPLTWHDILIVAPYNSHVYALQERLPQARVGTVDRFQGQEAAVVIYSATTSSPQDAPRGMEFLYSLNRLNVATSRARCAVFLVCSPRLFEPDCQAPRQMRLANALCRFVELSRNVRSDGVASGSDRSVPQLVTSDFTSI